MPLIKKIYEAVQNGELKQPFLTKDIKQWIKINNIVKDDGGKYAETSINAILSNSDTKNNPTTNKNFKILKSRVSGNGKNEYFF
jgi:hypothetical protein